jgi:hypothetical protein
VPPRLTDLHKSVALMEPQPAFSYSFSWPRITILSASSSNGRCSAFASSHGARIQPPPPRNARMLRWGDICRKLASTGIDSHKYDDPRYEAIPLASKYRRKIEVIAKPTRERPKRP